MWEVPETSQKVVRKSHFVSIDSVSLSHFVKTLVDKEVTIPPWDTSCHYEGDAKDVVTYILVLDTLNFCFWPAAGAARWEIEYHANHLSGYYGLAAALKKALAAGIPLTDADYLSDLSVDKLNTTLSGHGSLQLMDARVRNLNELGRIIHAHYHGEAWRLLDDAHGSALALTRILADRLTSFRDVARYGEETVYFYKRAQIVAADLFGAFAGTGWGRFADIDQLTAFADYKLPQVLRHLGIIVYAPELAHSVDSLRLLDPGSPEEIEIRANTIWAVELIRRQLRSEGKDLKAHEIDWILWNKGQEDAYRAKPYHRTKTIFY